MQRSTWKDSWEVCGLFLPVVNFFFIFSFTLSTHLMFCWTGVPIRYYFSHNALHWKEFWDKPLIIPKTSPSTVLTWFNWFWLLISSFSQQTPPFFSNGQKMLQSPFPWQEQDLENNEWKFWSPSSCYGVGKWAASFLLWEMTLSEIQYQWREFGVISLAAVEIPMVVVTFFAEKAQ